MSDLVSIIVPVFNRKEAFLDALRSIGAQEYTSIELVVVDDGSTEFSILDVDIELPQHIQVKKIRQNNQGAQSARNVGFAKSTGAYVIFWDADVVGEPHMLQKMYRALIDSPQAAYAYSNFKWGGKKMPSKSFSASELKRQNYIHTTSLVRRDVFPGFDESIKRFQDWDLWLTMLQSNISGIYIDEYLFSIKTKGTISSWLPSFCYSAPWKWLPWVRGKVVAYEEARKRIQHKHKLI